MFLSIFDNYLYFLSLTHSYYIVLKSWIFFQASLRNCINCVHCDDHFFIFITTVLEIEKVANSKKNGRNFLSSRPAPLFARLSHLRLPHSFVPSPLSESLERAFPDTVSFHTYPVNPAYESATFWIRSPEWTFLHTLWIRNRADANSGYFFIRWHNKIELSSLLWILYSRWQPRSQVLRRQSKMQISRALWRRLFCHYSQRSPGY